MGKKKVIKTKVIEDEPVQENIHENDGKVTSDSTTSEGSTGNTTEDAVIKSILTPSEEILNDPTLKLSNQRVAEAREAVANGSKRVYRIYSDGIFDLFHIGHMNVLKQAKFALGNPENVHLIVGVCSDADTINNKGNVVMDEKTRADTVAHCKWVDEVIPNSPWVLTPEFIEKHKIDFVAHDAVPYVSGDCEDVYAYVKSEGKFLATERTNGISTTDIIVQIVRDYDVYVVRNLKRGVGKKELNVGKTWEIRAVAHEKGKKLDENIEKIQNEKKQLITTFSALKEQIKNTNLLCTLNKKSRKTKENAQTPPTKILQETTNVLKHSWKLTLAVLETSASVLSYLNVFSYIDKCRQTKQYAKKQE